MSLNMSETIRVRVVYLGGSRGETGISEEDFECARNTTLSQIAQRVAEKYPALAPRLATVRWALNHEFASLSDPLSHGDEVALIPPVAGGSPEQEPPSARERVSIQSAPLDIASAVKRVEGAHIGAIVTFIGTVRDHARGTRVISLDYEAYEPMASRVLEQIVVKLESEIEGVTVAIAHRTGLLEVGEQSVAIAASSPHRDAAYTACRAALEEIKKDLPIWKRETTAEGDEWVGWGGG